MKDELVIDMDPKTGSVRIEVNGASGRRCLQLTRSLEEALGPVRARRMKPEVLVERVVQEGRLCLRKSPRGGDDPPMTPLG